MMESLRISRPGNIPQSQHFESLNLVQVGLVVTVNEPIVWHSYRTALSGIVVQHADDGYYTSPLVQCCDKAKIHHTSFPVASP